MNDTEFVKSMLSDLKRLLEISKNQRSCYNEYSAGFIDGKESELESSIEKIEDYLKHKEKTLESIIGILKII